MKTYLIGAVIACFEAFIIIIIIIIIIITSDTGKSKL